MSKGNIFERLQKVDSRYLFWISVVILTIPLLMPLGIPFPISSWTRELYTFIDKLPAGSVVGVACDVSVGQWSSLEVGWVAIMKVLFAHPLKLIIWSMDATGPRCWDLAFIQIPPELLKNKVYGVDYVTYGYIPGIESGVAAIASNTWGTLAADRSGTPTSQIPMMANIHSAKDFAAVWGYEQGVGTTESYIRQWSGPYGVPYLLGTTPAGILNYMRFYGKEIRGILTGTLGAAELELLTGYKGKAIVMMDTNNLIHIMLLCFLVFGNIMYWGARYSKKKEPEDSSKVDKGGKKLP